jgi:hypothetical protein
MPLAVVGVGFLVQVADRRLAHLARKVDEVAIVGDTVVVDPRLEARREGLRVLPGYALPVLLGLGIARHVLEAQLARIRPLEIAKLVLQKQAALAHVHRRERVVAFRSDVPVDRNCGLDAAGRTVRVVGREQPALAPVLQGKGGERRGENGRVEEAQPGTLGLAFLRLVIELDLGRLEQPVVVARPASRVARVLQAVLLLAEELDAARVAMGRQIALQQKSRLLEHAGIVERAVAQARAEETVDADLQPHPAVRVDAAELLVVFQVIAEDGELVLVDLGAAARRDLELADAIDALGIDRHRSLFLRYLCGRGSRSLREHWSRGCQGDHEHRVAVRHRAAGEFFRWCRIFNDTR